MKDARLLFHVHGRKFYLAPPRRPGGPYYIRFELPSNQRTRIRVVHRSLRTSVIAAAKARAKLIIEPILNSQWETAEKLKSRSGYATIGQLLERYQAGASDRANTVRNNSDALRLLVRTVSGGDPDEKSSSISASKNSGRESSRDRRAQNSNVRSCVNGTAAAAPLVT